MSSRKQLFARISYLWRFVVDTIICTPWPTRGCSYKQLPTMTAEVLSKKYNIPTTTILSWEKQLKTKDRKVSGKCWGVHLRSGNGHGLSYPKEVDERLLQRIMLQRDCHLPVGTELIRAKAKVLISPYNPNFRASRDWLHWFFTCNSLSLYVRTSISQNSQPSYKRSWKADFQTRAWVPTWADYEHGSNAHVLRHGTGKDSI